MQPQLKKWSCSQYVVSGKLTLHNSDYRNKLPNYHYDYLAERTVFQHWALRLGHFVDTLCLFDFITRSERRFRKHKEQAVSREIYKNKKWLSIFWLLIWQTEMHIQISTVWSIHWSHVFAHRAPQFTVHCGAEQSCLQDIFWLIILSINHQKSHSLLSLLPYRHGSKTFVVGCKHCVASHFLLLQSWRCVVWMMRWQWRSVQQLHGLPH